jgi:hypothetical protein
MYRMRFEIGFIHTASNGEAIFMYIYIYIDLQWI